MSISYEERLEFMLKSLEEEVDLNLYWDDITCEWEFSSKTNKFTSRGRDKYQLIQTTYSHLMH
jgi:hypothetical protein